jgi:hypothetical protein
MISEYLSDYRTELREVELAERLAEQDLQIERQKWQKGTQCNYNASKQIEVGRYTSETS